MHKEAKTFPVGPYTTTGTLRVDPLRAWVTATGPDQAVLHIITPQLRTVEAKIFEQNAQLLEEIHHPQLLKPTHTLTQSEFGFVQVCPRSLEILIQYPLEKSPEHAWEATRQTLELLTTLHEANYWIGAFLPESLLWKDGQAFLFDLTLKPLIRASVTGSELVLSTHAAPEVATAMTGSVAADLYSFAQHIGFIDPELKSTAWYQRCTAKDPGSRPRDAKAALALLESERPIQVPVAPSDIERIEDPTPPPSDIEPIEVAPSDIEPIPTSGATPTQPAPQAEAPIPTPPAETAEPPETHPAAFQSELAASRKRAQLVAVIVMVALFLITALTAQIILSNQPKPNPTREETAR